MLSREGGPATMATITGTPGNDTLFGGGANDLILGAAGNDSLFGGKGDDTLVGGPGDDFVVGQEGTNTAQFSGNFASYKIAFSFLIEGVVVHDTVAGRDG